jgi:hypothetical protein
LTSFDLPSCFGIFWKVYVLKNIQMDLKEHIQSKGLKFKWVADKIGVNYITFNAYLNNERNMPQEVSDKVLKLIGK